MCLRGGVRRDQVPFKGPRTGVVGPRTGVVGPRTGRCLLCIFSSCTTSSEELSISFVVTSGLHNLCFLKDLFFYVFFFLQSHRVSSHLMIHMLLSLYSHAVVLFTRAALIVFVRAPRVNCKL